LGGDGAGVVEVSGVARVIRKPNQLSLKKEADARRIHFF
jgi:hypothetical protein